MLSCLQSDPDERPKIAKILKNPLFIVNPKTGLNDSPEDKFIERQLDLFAKVQVNIRYEEGKKISEGSKGATYEVFRDG